MKSNVQCRTARTMKDIKECKGTCFEYGKVCKNLLVVRIDSESYFDNDYNDDDELESDY